MIVAKPEWVWTPRGLLRDRCVEIDAASIVGVVPADRHPDVPVARGRLLLPGLVNVHSHAFQRAFRGHVQWRAAGQDDFWSWRDRMYAVANRLDPDGIEAVSALAFLEMAEAGITKVGEFHYLQHAPDGARYADPDELAKRVIAAARAVGIRICLLRVAYARAGAGAPLRDDQRRFGDRSAEDVLLAVERLAKVAEVGLAPHSVRAVPIEWLRAFSGFPGVVHAHVSEQPGENRACLAEHGRSPLAVFDDAGLMSERFTAVHLTHPLEGDVDRMAAQGAAVGLCPSTELDLGDGFLPVAARERLRIGLGSDSQAVIDPLGEARALELHARALAGRRNVLAPEGDRHGLAERLLRAASTDGDAILGGRGQGIAAGAPADFVLLDLDRAAADGVPPLEAAAFVATPEWVDEVWVGGRRIVEGGCHPDRDRIRARARSALS